MNLYNKYLMRASGEKKHQPQNVFDAMAFCVFDWMTQTDSDVFSFFIVGKTESELSSLMENLSNHLWSCRVDGVDRGFVAGVWLMNQGFIQKLFVDKKPYEILV